MIRIRRPLGCGTALVAALLALACLLARPLGAQMPAPAPLAADSLWEAMGTCSGLPIQPGGDLADVKWRYDSTRVGDQRRGFAEWLPPDTVVVPPDADLWELAHELLHHRARGPATMPFPHPLTPFAFPCHVMPWQHGMGTPLQPLAPTSATLVSADTGGLFHGRGADSFWVTNRTWVGRDSAPAMPDCVYSGRNQRMLARDSMQVRITGRSASRNPASLLVEYVLRTGDSDDRDQWVRLGPGGPSFVLLDISAPPSPCGVNVGQVWFHWRLEP